ncbi:hypothetical protein AK812_SmicGene42954 [Symbiodinium microadriaticum]|uniref:Uncharacterized protein n=1 Tax=Symbiodinium microadriaticum TaxID=2951 RepID=A0A1Q9C292_SYMMI|nr:hypothetical protein AK812_SmicGene42954 [Symbiodinium microadriaticum]
MGAYGNLRRHEKAILTVKLSFRDPFSKVHFRSGKKFSVDMAEFIGYHTYVDTDHLRTDIFKMQTSLDMGVKKNKDHLDFEVKRLEPFGNPVSGPANSRERVPMIHGELCKSFLSAMVALVLWANEA